MGSSAIKRRASVVLPAPDGDDSTNNSPRRAIGGIAARSTGLVGLVGFVDIGLLDVLDLLAQLIDHGFECQPVAGDFGVVAFGAERVGFAVEFLGEEVEFAADRLGGVSDPVGMFARPFTSGELAFLRQLRKRKGYEKSDVTTRPTHS